MVQHSTVMLNLPGRKSVPRNKNALRTDGLQMAKQINQERNYKQNTRQMKTQADEDKKNEIQTAAC